MIAVHADDGASDGVSDALAGSDDAVERETEVDGLVAVAWGEVSMGPQPRPSMLNGDPAQHDVAALVARVAGVRGLCKDTPRLGEVVTKGERGVGGW